jgi:hypothetical protein
MHDAWVQLMNTYSSTSGVLVASADCSTNSGAQGSGYDLCRYYNLPYYPFIVYGNPASVQEYNGARDYSSLYSFAKQNLGAAVNAVEPESAPQVNVESQPVCSVDTVV